MSMPFLSFSCSRCDFRASSTVCWGRFSYDGPSGLIPLNKGIGWCKDCSKIVPVEILPSIQRIEELKSEITENKRHVTQYEERIKQSRSKIKNLLKISVNLPHEIEKRQWQCEYLSGKIEEEQQRLKLLSFRKSEPRCLRCASVNCFLFPKDFKPLGSSESPGPPVEIGVTHPRCGGNLRVEHSGIRLNMGIKHRIYDTEGCLIRRED